ncbi:ABC transporter substrate-binding protein, partial [Enterobacter hormaechei]|uniref:ABC transporter substrate-binding protein n=1 Tax=Enterobacter hormaechei TaxID=158836 RepID=UPI001F0B0D18
IGTGPFALQQYKQDSLIRYIANPHYWQGEVASKHLIFSITPDPQTRLDRHRAVCAAAVQTGFADPLHRQSALLAGRSGQQ